MNTSELFERLTTVTIAKEPLVRSDQAPGLSSECDATIDDCECESVLHLPLSHLPCRL